MAAVSAPEPVRARDIPAEAWILAGMVDGRPALPALDDNVGGLPHLMRIAGELAMAGIQRAYVIVREGVPRQLLEALRADPRLAKISLTAVPEPPSGASGDAIVVVRSDRLFHRDIPKAAVTAWTRSSAKLAKVAGDEHDAVVVTDRVQATVLARNAREPGKYGAELRRAAPDGGEVALAAVPYLGFTAPITDRPSMRRAERRLVWSLRKSADGIASKLLNRRLSLPITYTVMRTRLLPNHVTLAALGCAIAGAFVIARGGYTAGVLGMLLVNFGSIIDGVDGEIARLKFQFSRLGQWLDTLADDVGNVFYSGGIMLNLDAAGVHWAWPLWVTATTCFVLTQSSQYWLIRRVYGSGDLAAIPWAFQSSDFLSQRPKGLWPWLKTTAPKLLKRDSALTIFVGCALAGHLDWILVAYSAGALVFFVVFFVQFARNAGSVRRALRERK
jgi:phosphatidylglycerophosphate synthase